MNDTRELSKIYDLTDPWIATTIDREPWQVTLTSGRKVTLHLPLGAACELETRGYRIIAEPAS